MRKIEYGTLPGIPFPFRYTPLQNPNHPSGAGFGIHDREWNAWCSLDGRTVLHWPSYQGAAEWLRWCLARGLNDGAPTR